MKVKLKKRLAVLSLLIKIQLLYNLILPTFSGPGNIFHTPVPRSLSLVISTKLKVLNGSKCEGLKIADEKSSTVAQEP